MTVGKGDVCCGVMVKRGHECERREELHQRTKGLPHPAPLFRRQPEHARAFDRPDRGGELTVERKRHRECGKNQRKRGVTQSEPVRERMDAGAHYKRKRNVDKTRHHRRDCRCIFDVRHQLRLQREGDKRRAENQHAVERVPLRI